MKTMVEKLVVRNRYFTVIKKDGNYLAIEDKYITDGKLNTTLYGPQMHISDTLAGCVDNTKKAVEIDYLVEQGYSRARAFCTVFDMMDSLDAVEELFTK